MESALHVRNRLISTLIRASHGNLREYIVPTLEGFQAEPDFISHLIAWNLEKGQIRDSKVAIPTVAWGATKKGEYRDNAKAALASLDPRNFLRALRFAHGSPHIVPVRQMRKLAEGYLRYRESSAKLWDRATLQHRRSMKELYARFHIKPFSRAQKVLFKREYPKGSVFQVLRDLPNLKPEAAAGMIIKHKIPFLVARSIVGSGASITLAMLEQMSPTEVVTNARMFKRLGVETDPALRAAFEAALQKAAEVKTLKTARAADVVSGKALKAKLQKTQEKQLDKMAVEGDWLVLGDRSGSMSHSIETSREVAATLARLVAGKVHLVFFNYAPTYFDVTGKTLDEIKEKTRGITATGSTSVGCGLDYILSNGVSVDGIAIVSDGCENQPPRFSAVYRKATKAWGKEAPVYLYLLQGAPNQLKGLETFDLRQGVDYYSLPNLVQTMRTNRYSLVDEILETPLLTLEKVFRKEKVHA